jgi:integrase
LAHHLTDAAVKRLPPPAKGNKVYYDDAVAGFGCRVTAAGHRAFVLSYRTRAGRERRYTIGDCADWQTTAARAEAKRLRRLIDQGGDPLADIEAERDAATMTELIERFVGEHVEPHLRPNTARHYRMLIARHVRAHFPHTKVDEIEPAHIDALHRKVTRDGGPYIANRAVGLLSKMFSFAIRMNMRTDGVNPARGTPRNYEAKRKRYLKGDELARLTAALAAHPNQQAANIIRLLLLTGCRRMEAMAARWADIDLTEGVWTKPGSATKQKADHVAPLSAPARQLLAEIRAQQTSERRPLGAWVFPSDSSTGHVVELARAWRTICKAADIQGLRVHDLRHSFASQLASGGASLPLIGALLGHASPSTTHRYAHLFDDPQRAAAEKVGAVIAAAGKDAKAGEDMVETFPEGGRRGR